ncbi:MAG: hypothetical protein RJA44_905, partial [Pseudomonadota bacterium]
AVYSMTGYASASGQVLDTRDNPADVASAPARSGRVTIDLRSVNSRFLDLVLKLPDECRAMEPALRELVTAGFKRGKIELKLTTELGGGAAAGGPTSAQLDTLAQLQQSVLARLPQAAPLSVHEVLGWCRGSAPAVSFDEPALAACRQAVERLREARGREGDRLVAILMERVDKLRVLARQAEPLVPQVVARQQARFLERWNEALHVAGAPQVAAEALTERAMSEAATFAIRIDVAEELSRLGAHLDEIERLLKAGGELGKRLDFMIQELHREANTLGSKSAALELTQISLEMKVLIEQLREQVQNIE